MLGGATLEAKDDFIAEATVMLDLEHENLVNVSLFCVVSVMTSIKLHWFITFSLFRAKIDLIPPCNSSLLGWRCSRDHG